MDFMKYMPKGGMCMNCCYLNDDCSTKKFKEMQVIQKQKDTMVVKCDDFSGAKKLDADEKLHNLFNVVSNFFELRINGKSRLGELALVDKKKGDLCDAVAYIWNSNFTSYALIRDIFKACGASDVTIYKTMDSEVNFIKNGIDQRDNVVQIVIYFLLK